MKSAKRAVSSLLALTLVFGTFLGCTKNDSNKSTQGQKETAENSLVSPAGQYPIMKEKTNFSVMAVQANYVKDLPTNDFTKYYEDLTNIHLDFQIVPSANKGDKVSVALASGDYPDMFLYMGLSSSTIQSYANQGIIVPFTPYIDKYSPNLQKVFKEYPVMKNILTYPDGNIYTYSQMEDSSLNTYKAKMWVYRPWMQKLNIKEPETTEDFYQMLKAFKEKDPNGNGKQDEIGVVGALDGSNNQVDMFLMTPFIYNDGGKRFILNKGKLDVAYTQPEWKEGLKYMNKLYKEGLIAPESFTQTREQRIQMVSGPDVTVAALPASTNNSYVNYGMADKRDENYYTIKPLKGPSGKGYAVYNPEGLVNNNGQLVMTNKCKYPEAITRWADGFLTEDMTMRSVYGVENTNWRKAKTEEKGALGETGVYTLINNWTDIQNFAWKRNGPDFRNEKLVIGEVYTSNFENNTFLEAKRNYIGKEPPLDQIVGSIVLDSEQLESIADTDKSINSYVSESLARFVTGNKNIDTEWDSYLQELKKMGLDKYLEVYRTAYDKKAKSMTKK